MAARQRREAARVLTIAHQTEAMARTNKLPDLPALLRKIRRSRSAEQPDQGQAVAAMLERRAAKRERAARRQIRKD